MTTARHFAGSYDPAHVSAILMEARRMRNAILIGFFRRIFVRQGERRETPQADGFAAAGT